MIIQILFTGIIICAYAAEDCLEFNTNYGQINGFPGKTDGGKDFCTFHNVPFAKPPIGKLRLKNPEKPEPWEGVRNGVEEHSSCSQPAYDYEVKLRAFDGQEDCLYLSIYAPKVRDNLLPVMVYIHGGSFIIGAGTKYEGRDLVDADGVVLVSINYRLGVLGFLSTEDAVIPGNIGMRDQVFALKWVQDNIKYFSGDPDQVTIFGASAGAAAVHFHILSPESKGLFNRAILQSGTAISPWAHSYGHRGIALQVGAALGCFTPAEIGEEQSLRLLTCLQQVTKENLTMVINDFMTSSFLPANFSPYADGHFLLDESEILLRNGESDPVDIIIGVTRDEGGLQTLDLLTGDLLEKLQNNFNYYGPVSIGVSYEENAEELSRKIYDHYQIKETIDLADAEELNKLYSDSHFTVSTDITAQMHTGKVYLYQFAYRGNNSLASLFNIDFGKEWAVHGDDLLYLFPIKSLQNNTLNAEDQKIKDIMTKMWTNFAISGNPTPDDSLDFKWETFDNDSPKHLVINLQPKMQDVPRSEIGEFWNSLPTKGNKLLFG